MLELETGLAGRAHEFYRRHHTLAVTVVVSVTGIATGAATAAAVWQAFPLFHILVLITGAALAVLPVYALTRHWGVAGLVAVAPLPGLIWAAPIAVGSDFGMVPLLAYGFGLSAAIFYADEKLARVLQNGPRLHPFRPFWGVCGALVLAAQVWFHGQPGSDAALQIAADSLLTLTGVVLLLPLALSFIPLDDAFIVRANRAKEIRARRLEGLAFAALPRWGLSLTGVGAVALALGWFGAGLSLGGAWLALPVSGAVLLALGWWAGGGWREAVAVLLTGAVGVVMTLWALKSAGAEAPVLHVATLGLAVALTGLRRVRIYRFRGEMPSGARGRALEDSGVSLAMMAATGLVLLTGAIAHPGAAALLWSGLVASLAGLLLAPAAVTALEAVFPRRRSLEDLYGRRRTGRD